MYAKPQNPLCNQAWTEYHAGISAAWIRNQIVEVLSGSCNEAVSDSVQCTTYCRITDSIIQQNGKEIMHADIVLSVLKQYRLILHRFYMKKVIFFTQK